MSETAIKESALHLVSILSLMANFGQKLVFKKKKKECRPFLPMSLIVSTNYLQVDELLKKRSVWN